MIKVCDQRDNTADRALVLHMTNLGLFFGTPQMLPGAIPELKVRRKPCCDPPKNKIKEFVTLSLQYLKPKNIANTASLGYQEIYF